MNFNEISKAKIDKVDFDESVRSNNEERMCMYLYKIANIIANCFQVYDYNQREDLIQDAVYTAYKRRRGFSFDKNSSAYSYFYKMITNHFKDIWRKNKRRSNIAVMTSYDKTEDNVHYTISIGDKFFDKLSSNRQHHFVDYSRYVNFDNRKRKKRDKRENAENIIQYAFV